jgi:hypothetical protein
VEIVDFQKIEGPMCEISAGKVWDETQNCGVFFKGTVDYVNSASTSTYDRDEFLPFQTLTEATYKLNP